MASAKRSRATTGLARQEKGRPFITVGLKCCIVIGRAKRAPHWGVQWRFRVIYICMYVGMSHMSN